MKNIEISTGMIRRYLRDDIGLTPSDIRSCIIVDGLRQMIPIRYIESTPTVADLLWQMHRRGEIGRRSIYRGSRYLPVIGRIAYEYFRTPRTEKQQRPKRKKAKVIPINRRRNQGG